MTLKKAIKILTLTTSITPKVHPPDEHKAIKLGIEALKELIAIREWSPEYKKKLLPGEE